MDVNETENKKSMASIHLLQYTVVGSCGNECSTEEVNSWMD